MWPTSVLLVSTLLWICVLTENCYTPQGVASYCVNIYYCSELLDYAKQQSMSQSAKDYLKKSQCGFEGSAPMVCCGPPPKENIWGQQPAKRPYHEQTDTGSNYAAEDSELAPPNECGIDTTGDKVFGGEDTELDEFPWMALLGFKTPAGTITYQCGGSLINHRYVLTAAHCITGIVEHKIGILTTVRLGEHDTSKEVDCKDSLCAPPPQEIPVLSAHPHPGYVDRNKNRKDDIGIVRLARRASYTYYVNPICLTDSTAQLEPGDTLTVAGWGRTLYSRNSAIKQKLSVPMFNKQQCVATFKSFNVHISENQLCAGGIRNKDTCRGDSGGPLMRQRPEGVWEAVGLVSSGYGCGTEGVPGIYTSVANYKEWIRSVLRSTNN